jgi:hydrogenase nickel incorporation protein HypB
VTEGDDKPAKYPVMFRAADLLLLTKTDLLPVLDDFNPERAEGCLRALANPAPVLRLSARKHLELDGWLNWLRAEVRVRKQQAAVRSMQQPLARPAAAPATVPTGRFERVG